MYQCRSERRGQAYAEVSGGRSARFLFCFLIGAKEGVSFFVQLHTDKLVCSLCEVLRSLALLSFNSIWSHIFSIKSALESCG